MDGWSKCFGRTPAGGYGRNFVWGFLNGPWIGGSDGFLVINRESEALGGADGDVVELSKRVCHSVERTGPG